MSYTKTFWLNKNDPNFNISTSPPIDADNLNKMEQGIWDAINQVVSSDNNYSDNDKATLDGLYNLLTATSKFTSTTSQDIGITETQLSWDISGQSTNLDLFELTDATNLITFKKAGVYNIKHKTTFYKDTINTILVTINVTDLFTNDIWGTEAITLDIPTGTSLVVYHNTKLEFVSSDLPKTLEVNHISNGSGISITGVDYDIITFNKSEATNISHNDLTGRDASDAHPIGAITGLSSALSGILLSGEVS